MRVLVVAVLAASVVCSGCVVPGLGGDQAAVQKQQDAYVRDVTVAIHSLTLVFAQADESVKAVQNGWLAPEGAAAQFEFLHNETKDIKTDINQADPPADLEGFHTELGRSVSLTQQAMDAMQQGFQSGDSTYFDLAHQKLSEARQVLNKAANEL
jgi:hypothetical protein